MKKIIASILLLTLMLSCLCSCFRVKKDETPSTGSGTGTSNTPQTPEAVDGAIYSAGSTLGFLVADDTVYTSPLFNALAKKTKVVKVAEDGEAIKNEIVVGLSNRPVSMQAYDLLDEMHLSDEQIDDAENYTKWLIYTDGSSVAIAYDEQSDYIGLRAAVDFFVNNYISDTLVLEPGVIKRGVVNIYEFYLEEQRALAEIKWDNIAKNVENGEEIVAALKSLYSLYSDDLVSWMANLYEPAICACFEDECTGQSSTCGTAGFYYSNSARNTDGYLPDVESTNQMLNMLESFGMTKDYTKDLDPVVLEKIGKFVLSLQHSDGYFYHPQWGTGVTTGRKSRDLMWAESIMRRLGLSPIYTTPNGTQGTGVPVAAALTAPITQGSSVSVASRAVAAAEYTGDPNLKDKESFIAYLEALDVKNNAYSAGNTLAAQFNTIRSRNYQLQREGADYDLIDILIDHLDNAQNPETGTWYYLKPGDKGYSQYTEVNGVMKISCVYEAAGKPMPNADKSLRAAMAAITSDAEVTACVDIYNTWFTINNIYTIMNQTGGAEGKAIVSATKTEIRQRAAELIGATKEKVAVFQKNDGSFSYGPLYSSSTAQGALAAVPYTIEGDVNATTICSASIVSHIWAALGLSSHEVSIFNSAHMYRFNSIILELGHALKEDQDISFDIENGENYGTGKYKDQALSFEGIKTSDLVDNGTLYTDKPDYLLFGNYNFNTNVTIVETDDYTNILSFKKSVQNDPALFITPQSTDAKSYVFEADICILSGTTKMNDGQVFQIYFMNGDTFWWPSAHVLTNADAYEGVNRYYVDNAKNYTIDQNVWYNYRIEVQDIGTAGSDVRLYINNVLVQKKFSSATISDITRMQVRFRMDSGISQILMDNVYFGAVKNLPADDTMIIPDVNVKEYYGSDDIDATNRGTSTTENNRIEYTNTNATLLFIDGKIGTSGLVYDPNDTAGSSYLKVVSVKGDAVLDYGKNSGSGDPWLYIPQTERRDGKSYVFETDFAFIDGSEWRGGDNNLFSMYLSQNASNSIFWGVQWHIAIEGNKYYLYIPTKNAEGNIYYEEIDLNKWYNFKVEIDGLKTGDAVKFYVNGELIHTALMTSTTSSISHMLLRFNLNATGRVFLDNTFFGATGEVLPDVPDTPDPEIPSAGSYDKGNGSYANASGVLTYDSTTATALSEAGTLVATDGASIDGSNIYAKVSGGEMILANNQWSSQGYISLKASSTGKSYVFESDMMLDASAVSLGSSRDYGAIFEMYTSANGTGTLWGGFASAPRIGVKTINGNTKCYINIGGVERVVGIGEWFNLRVEYQDVTVSGSSIRYYVNGELLYTHTSGSANAGFQYTRFWLAPQASGTLHMDNTYFGTATFTEVGGDDDNGGEGGGNVEITPPDPAETVKNTANILSTETGADGIVVLMHDDASSTMYIMDEVFRELGLRGNIAMYPSGVLYTDGSIDASKVANWQAYLDTGRWQLSSHSMTHTFPGLTDDAGKITEEVINSQLLLRELFPSQRVLTYAYPGYWSEKAQYGDGRYSEIMRELVGANYIAGRDAYGDKNIVLSDKNVDWTFSPSYQFSSSNVNAILEAIAKTQNGEMAVLFTHMIAADNATLGSNQMYEKDLRTICEAVAALQDEGKVWVAFYEDAVLYVRESQNATVTATTGADSITVTLTHTLDQSIYNYPLTVRVVTPESWQAVKITQGARVSYATVKTVAGKSCIDASIVPNAENAVITPISVNEIPADTTDNSASENRGSGILANSALDFSDTTATELKTEGLIGAEASVNMDAIAMGVVVANEGGDESLKIGNAWGTEGKVYLNSQTAAGKKYVFETDILVIAGGTNRSDDVIYQLYGSKNANSVNAYWGFNVTILEIDGQLYFGAAGATSKHAIETDVWYNIRVEIDDITSGGQVRYYLNGALVYTTTTTSTASSLGSIVVWMPATTSGRICLDNTFIGATDTL